MTAREKTDLIEAVWAVKGTGECLSPYREALHGLRPSHAEETQLRLAVELGHALAMHELAKARLAHLYGRIERANSEEIRRFRNGREIEEEPTGDPEGGPEGGAAGGAASDEPGDGRPAP